MCASLDCDRRSTPRSIYCADCKRRLKKEKATTASRWAQAHAEGRLTPEDRAEISREGRGKEDLFLEEYEAALLLE